MLLSEQLLIESLLLTEDIANEGNLIFDRPEIIQQAKSIYSTGDISVHALYPDERYDWITSNKDAHMLTIRKFLVADYNKFASIYNEKLAKVKAAKRQLSLYGGSNREMQLADKVLEDFKKFGKIHNDVPRKIGKLMPYAQDERSGYILCFKFDGTYLHKIVVSPADNCIITAYRMMKHEVMERAEAFRSVELLSIATYGEITNDQKELYYAIKLLGTSPADETKWLYKIGFKPQTKQTDVRRLEAELKEAPVTRPIIQ